MDSPADFPLRDISNAPHYMLHPLRVRFQRQSEVLLRGLSHSDSPFGTDMHPALGDLLEVVCKLH